MPPSGPLLVDVHTHMYPPKYMELLRARTSVPYVAEAPAGADGKDGQRPAPRLVILPTDDDASVQRWQRGRPISSDYWSVARKKRFMRRHGIRASVVSLANPWLDWVAADEAAAVARAINEDLEAMCAGAREEAASDGNKEDDGSESDSSGPCLLYHFATLPLSAPMHELVAAVDHAASLPHARGVVMGTTGLGRGLDDRRLDPLWAALERRGSMVFVHPHYGLPADVFGDTSASGHVLPLALGFPMETTIAFARMYLAGVFARFPALKILLAHAGGTLPFLAGRLESCLAHERAAGVRQASQGDDGLRAVLRRNVWLDGVVYGSVGVRAAVDTVGADRVLWGTDHPFFPPLDADDAGDSLPAGGPPWPSVTANIDAAVEAFKSLDFDGRDGGDGTDGKDGKDNKGGGDGGNGQGVAGVLGLNAARALNLDLDLLLR